ncbi:DUF1566 domain-containing protein [Leptospira gomenensis]|uniref:DUF1566 domain-containing protein n=1 Tax=Leptospira gomenensis TaxID=2484974 RepID=A0A5F1YBI8_9LEPT|nr:DUF1566 domain-containing protein [Leptospira gomenensis]TGK34498.1 DUF1566 domain-containing protein [Leptospira gomenensis]TGK40192.1 DUF1566 domain-containing protein [Leptospira gomenensis]TGK41883.1 DUF1566 domain-containing protein [Leptospira gomenensis]TGK55701.1 DUF1566 domain-containing protein [Leptospira gomenensis]
MSRFIFYLSIVTIFCLTSFNFGCYLNPYFKEAVTVESYEDSSWTSLLIFAGTPILQGDTVLFPWTGLRWMRCSYGELYDQTQNECTFGAYFEVYCSSPDNQCNGSVSGGKLTSGQAFSDCQNSSSNYIGGTGWRVPTVTELKSLVYCSNGVDVANSTSTNGCAGGDGDFEVPTIRKWIFPGQTLTSLPFWSSSSNSLDPSTAWSVDFSSGIANQNTSKTSIGVIRCVQGGSP